MMSIALVVAVADALMNLGHARHAIAAMTTFQHAAEKIVILTMVAHLPLVVAPAHLCRFKVGRRHNGRHTYLNPFVTRAGNVAILARCQVLYTLCLAIVPMA